jgi:transposase
MSEVTTIGLDLAKHVFQVHGVDAAGATVLRKQLRRGQVVAFFAALPHCLVGLEACATAHYWARELQAVGHEVRLMPAQYVKAYVKRNKNDAADAAAICEAVGRPSMRFVAIKTAEQQAALLLHRGRERLVRQRTGLVNALRAHLAEFGVIAPHGLRNVAGLIAIVRDESDTRLPDLARQVLQVLATQLEQLGAAVAAIEKQLTAWHRKNPVSQRLASIPGVGPIIATALAATVVGADRVCQRPRIRGMARSGAAAALDRWQSAPWRHLQTRQPVFATSADQRCQRQSAALESNQRRSVGHRAAPPPAKPGACGAVANKTARIAWAVMRRQESYRHRSAAA